MPAISAPGGHQCLACGMATHGRATNEPFSHGEITTVAHPTNCLHLAAVRTTSNAGTTNPARRCRATLPYLPGFGSKCAPRAPRRRSRAACCRPLSGRISSNQTRVSPSVSTPHRSARRSTMKRPHPEASPGVGGPARSNPAPWSDTSTRTTSSELQTSSSISAEPVCRRLLVTSSETSSRMSSASSGSSEPLRDRRALRACAGSLAVSLEACAPGGGGVSKIAGVPSVDPRAILALCSRGVSIPR